MLDFISVTVSFLAGGLAQSYDWDDEKKIRGRRSAEKMENMIVWRLTDELDLSTDQAEKFFPRFRELRKSLEKIGKQEREMMKLEISEGEVVFSQNSLTHE